jgi:hypothetical protein
MKKTNVKIEKEDTKQNYSYYSRVLEKPFDTIEELTAAEAAHFNALKAKEDAAAQKKADAKVVEDAFKALNVARKEYKDNLTQLTTEYAESLENLKKAFDLGKSDIASKLANAEEASEKALKEFSDKYGTYHFSIKDGDFETTISGSTTTAENKAAPKTSDIFDIFDWIFRV